MLVILAALPDLLDGALAKASNNASQRGAFFDSVADRVTDCCCSAASPGTWRRQHGRTPPCCRSP